MQKTAKDRIKRPNLWQSTPRSSSLIFLLAVFFIFTCFGFANDAANMGREPAVRFWLAVVLSGLFAVAYAVTGISLRGRFWMGVIPIFILQFAVQGYIAHKFPDAPQAAEMNASDIARLESRLGFDGLCIVLSVCIGYAGLTYVSISEGRRHIRAQSEKASLEGEMAAAREVQRGMVPEQIPEIDGYSIECVYKPAAEVGGDFFQVIPLRSGRTLIVIGDVSGKGLRAAMIVSMIVGNLRTVSGYTEEPAEILSELNRCLHGHMREGFATCLAVRLEERGKLTLANAGHLPPYLAGSEMDFAGSLPLGLVEGTVYEQTSVELGMDDVFVLLTDGIAEAQNEERVLLGFVRVESLLREGATAKSLAEAAQRQGQQDDMTVLRLARQA